MSKYDDLPTWEELCEISTWVGRGCPAYDRTCDPCKMVEGLYKLLNGLPHHLPHYAWGTDEWRAELERLRARGESRPICQARHCLNKVIEESDYCAEHQG